MRLLTPAVRMALRRVELTMQFGSPVELLFRTVTACARDFPRSMLLGKLAIHFRPASENEPPRYAGMAMILLVVPEKRR
jgi:hypothetical protein